MNAPVSILLFGAMCLAVPYLCARAVRRFFLKLVAADNTQRAADQERHGETPCPPSVISPFHDAFNRTGGQ